MVILMDILNTVENIIKVGYINIVTYYVFLKIINDKSNITKTTIVIVISIIEEILGVILVKYLPRLPY